MVGFKVSVHLLTKSQIMKLLLTLSAIIMSATIATAPAQALQLSLLQTSESSGAFEATVVEGGSWFNIRHLRHHAVVIKHPQGTVLFDTGLGKSTPKAFQRNSSIHKVLFGFRNLHTAADQLSEIGIAPESIHAILVSHLHWDHSGGIPDFPGVPVWVHKAELEAAPHGHPPSYLGEERNANIKWHPFTPENRPYEGFDRSLDVFGDGALILVELPGHTPGHTGLFVNVSKEKRYFFTADTTWTLEGIQQVMPRPQITQWLTNVDKSPAENLHTIEKIAALIKRKPEIVIIPAHDENAARQLPAFPEFTKE